MPTDYLTLIRATAEAWRQAQVATESARDALGVVVDRACRDGGLSEEQAADAAEVSRLTVRRLRGK